MKLYIKYNVKDIFNHDQLLTAESDNDDVVQENAIKIISKMKSEMDYVIDLELNGGVCGDSLTYFYDSNEDALNKILTLKHYQGWNNSTDTYRKPLKEAKSMIKEYLAQAI